MLPVLVVVGWLPVASARADGPCNVLFNPGFEQPPILVEPQSPLEPGECKLTVVDPMHPNFASAISGIPAWTTATPDGASDSGLCRHEASYQGQYHAFINNWNRRLSQVSSLVVEPGATYRAEIQVRADVGSLPAPKAGRLSLVAGTPDPQNPDQFAPGSVVLGEAVGATAAWPNGGDVILEPNTWQGLVVEVTVPPDSPLVGAPLMVSIRTEGGSAGPMWWDDASLVQFSPSRCQADLDGNGIVDGADLGLLLAAWGPCTPE